jgi:hypothetical protein
MVVDPLIFLICVAVIVLDPMNFAETPVTEMVGVV